MWRPGASQGFSGAGGDPRLSDDEEEPQPHSVSRRGTSNQAYLHRLDGEEDEEAGLGTTSGHMHAAYQPPQPLGASSRSNLFDGLRGLLSSSTGGVLGGGSGPASGAVPPRLSHHASRLLAHDVLELQAEDGLLHPDGASLPTQEQEGAGGLLSPAADPSPPPLAPQKAPRGPRAPRKPRAEKKAYLKTWLCITSTGQTSLLQADKYKLTAQLGIQTRDLRLLDPAMSTTYPAAILCREQAIVVNLEHIKAIITVDRVLIVNHEDEAVARFVEELKLRIACNGGTGLPHTIGSMPRLHTIASTGELTRLAKGGGAGGPPAPPAPAPAPPLELLPFELRVLEICLDELASEYDVATTELEAAAYPALDTLAAKVTSPHLERVRRLKNRLVRLTTRVETVREVLEKFLDDDEDMHDLNLSAKSAAAARDAASALSSPVAGGGEAAGGGFNGGEVAGGGRDGGGGEAEVKAPQEFGPRLRRTLSSSSSSSASSASTDSSVMESEVAEVEMLLEAYFMHFDNTFNRLTTLSEYIKDTEDLVNIKLDQHRNQLITTDLILTAFTSAMAIVTTIAGIFGMNLDSGLQETPGVFDAVTIASCLGALCLFVGFVLWAARFGLLVFD